MGGLLEHIARACREARENADVTGLDVATRAQTTETTVSRFETGKRRPRGPRIDILVAAYAQETGRTELQIWQRAIELWQQGEK